MSIRFEKVDHEYSPKTPFAFLALQDIDLEFTEGKITAVIGATGSGKTTLIDLIPRFYDASAGEVLVDGKNVRDYTPPAAARPRWSSILTAYCCRPKAASPSASIRSGPVRS